MGDDRQPRCSRVSFTRHKFLSYGLGFDLSGWKCQIPVNASGALSGTTDAVEVTDMSALALPWITRHAGMYRFKSVSTGATTSGSTYPRAEFRHLTDRAYSETSEMKVVFRVRWLPSGVRTVVCQSLDGGGSQFKLEVTGGTLGGSDGLLKLKYDQTLGATETSITLRSNIAFDATGMSETISVRIRRAASKLEVFHGANVDGATADWSDASFLRDSGSGTYYWKYGNYLQNNSTTPVWAVVEFLTGTQANPAVVAGDTTAPAITSAALGTQTSTTQPITFDLDEDGTAFWIAATAQQSGITATQVIAGNLANDSAAPASGNGAVTSGSPTYTATLPSGLSGSHYVYFTVRDAAGNAGTPVELGPVTLDTTAPVLSSPVGTKTGSTTATIGATTNEGNGTLYGFVSTSATPPSAVTLIAGTGAAWAGNAAVSSTGAKTLSATGLTAATTYYAHLLHEDAKGNRSAISTSASFTTDAGGAALSMGNRTYGSNAGTGTDLTMSVPTGTAGRRLYAIVFCRTDATPVFSSGPAMTLVSRITNPTSYAAEIAVYSRVLDGSEGTSWTIGGMTWTGGAVMAFVVEGAASSMQQLLAGDLAWSTTKTAPSVTALAGEMIMRFVASNNQNISANFGLGTAFTAISNTMRAQGTYQGPVSAGATATSSATLAAGDQAAVATMRFG